MSSKFFKNTKTIRFRLNISKFVISEAVTDPLAESQAQSNVTSLTAPVDRAMTAVQREKRPLAPSRPPVCMYVCLSVRMEQLVWRWTDSR